MCLAQGHNTVTLVRVEPAAPLSRVKHSTTGPLCFLFSSVDHFSLANSVDPDEMMCFMTFHLGLHCLPNYVFRSVSSIQKVNPYVKFSYCLVN